MTRYLERYYGLVLTLALVAPLWVGAASSPSIDAKDALIWTGLLLACWSLIRKYPGFHVKGSWRKPRSTEATQYMRLLLGALLIDFGSKAVFFRWDYPYRIEVFKNFGLHSVFHETAFEPFHLVLSLYFAYVFVLGALFFRFSNSVLDRVWLASSTFALGGAAALFTERFLFGGVHNSFYFAGTLMWLCPTCASSRFVSYAWTPADFFVHAAFAPPLVLIASYFFSVPAAADSSN